MQLRKNNLTGKYGLPTHEGYSFIEEDQIVYCQANDIYAYVYTALGAKYFVSKSLLQIENILKGPLFFRCHKSYLINLHYVDRILRKSGCEVVMICGTKVPVSRTKKKELYQLLL